VRNALAVVAKIRLIIALSTFLIAAVFPAIGASPAMGAVKLTVAGAVHKTFNYAHSACLVDDHCFKYGVSNCNRFSLHVVACRAVNYEDTGGTCSRLVRVAAVPSAGGYRVRITGFGAWSCA
jgi:hypothetical protein